MCPSHADDVVPLMLCSLHSRGGREKCLLKLNQLSWSGCRCVQGLGLSVDENFAVVDECFPYIARRMLSDDDPRIRESLRTFIYNGENRLDVEKLEVSPPSLPLCICLSLSESLSVPPLPPSLHP